eukprot:CAMPEP_0117563752 /NCGR_PEP_ID=MMETSP0784-20121206/55662_1 /TAXON_ID=39447 /ORGANISM="" /LENGTH=167 /DNA_ID=CAMNT_0005361419 /DNA_START=874 /DNA_END=1374 /DNA_ORIENTATION=-
MTYQQPWIVRTSNDRVRLACAGRPERKDRAVTPFQHLFHQFEPDLVEDILLRVRLVENCVVRKLFHLRMFLFSEVAQRHNALVGAWSVGQYRLDDLRTVFVNLEAVQGPDAHRGSKVLDLSSQLQQDKLLGLSSQLQQDKLRTIGDVALVDRSIVAEFLASVQELHP